MELDQYSGDLEVDFEDEIKVQARPWLGLAVGIFVGIVTMRIACTKNIIFLEVLRHFNIILQRKIYIFKLA